MYQIPAASTISLEYPLFKIPLEQARKSARTEQKYYEKELSTVLGLLKETLNSPESNTVKLTKRLNALINKVSLKK